MVDAAKADPDLRALRRIEIAWNCFDDAELEDIDTCLARGWVTFCDGDYTYTQAGRVALRLRFQKDTA